MVVNEILGNVKEYDTKGKVLDTVWLDWYEQDKKLLKKTSDTGEEIGIRSQKPLREDDVLYADDNRILLVAILPSELAVIEVKSMQEMGKVCFELGNRHLSLSIAEHEVRVPYDEPTFLYLQKLGFQVRKETGKFTDYTVCHAHGTAHSHDSGHQHKV
ncbi:MAG: urease accessory protein UreE [Lachnospiraceae bacterium]